MTHFAVASEKIITNPPIAVASENVSTKPQIKKAELISTTVTVKNPTLDEKKGDEQGLVSTGNNITANNPERLQSVMLLELKLAQSQSELNLIKEYHSSLLTTVYWSLASLISIAVLMVGFGWWSNFRMHEKDKDRLKEEIKKNIDEMESRVDVNLSDNRTEYLKLLDQRLENLADRFSNDFTKLNSNVSENATEMKKNTRELNKFMSKTNVTLDQHSKDIITSECELREVEEKVWEVKGVFVNVLVTQSQGIVSAVENDDEYRINGTLARMAETLEKFNPQKDFITERAAKLISDNVELAREYHPINTIKVIDLLKIIPAE